MCRPWLRYGGRLELGSVLTRHTDPIGAGKAPPSRSCDRSISDEIVDQDGQRERLAVSSEAVFSRPLKKPSRFAQRSLRSVAGSGK